METFKLIQCLRSLSPIELRRFQQFVASSFFNRSAKSKKLLDWLCRFAPNFKGKALSKHATFRLLFPKLSYSEQKLKDELSLLYRLLRQFLAHLELEERPVEQELLALAQLRKRGTQAPFQTRFNAMQKQLDDQQSWDEERLWHQFRLADEGDRYYGQQQLRKADPHLQTRMDALDSYYLFLKLRGSCELLNRQAILEGEPPHLPLLPEISKFLQQNPGPYTNHALIALYRKVLQCLAEPEHEAYYQELVGLIEQHYPELSPEEAQALYKYAQNYCIRKINAGASPFLEEIFRLFQKRLENGQLISGGVMAHTDYTNIVTSGLRLQRYDWVERFMENYRDKLLPQYQEVLFSYNRANSHYEQRQFRPAMRLLQAIEIDDAFYAISTKVLLAKVYFESEEWESLFYHLQAFQRYLRRNKALSPRNRNHYLNFLTFLQRLLKLQDRRLVLTPEAYQQRLAKIAGQLDQAENTSNLDWLKRRCS